MPGNRKSRSSSLIFTTWALSMTRSAVAAAWRRSGVTDGRTLGS
jgi:hypothetical protein